MWRWWLTLPAPACPAQPARPCTSHPCWIDRRLGIPLIFGADVWHGMWTVFPMPLGEAASWELELARQTARATAVEATASGIFWTYSPMVDVARDQRWGRVAEGAGEDPFLGAAFARARVQGFQGDHGLAANDSMIACLKHYAGYGGVSNPHLSSPNPHPVLT